MTLNNLHSAFDNAYSFRPGLQSITLTHPPLQNINVSTGCVHTMKVNGVQIYIFGPH